MARFRIDYSLSGSIVIEAETEKDALSAYEDLGWDEIIAFSESSPYEKLDGIEEIEEANYANY